MKANEQLQNSTGITKQKQNGNSALKIKLLISELLNEVEILDQTPATTAASLTQNSDGISFFEEVKRFEIALIRNALNRSEGRQVRAARLLQLSVSTLNTKIKHYGIRPSAYGCETQTASVSGVSKRKQRL